MLGGVNDTGYHLDQCMKGKRGRKTRTAAHPHIVVVSLNGFAFIQSQTEDEGEIAVIR